MLFAQQGPGEQQSVAGSALMTWDSWKANAENTR